ncbi:hypothetical protein ACHQM5_023370 [Ranunculus cassubicifolius]
MGIDQKKKKKPSFIKVMIGTFSDRLQIPPAFVKYFKPKFPKTILLKVSIRVCWNVKLKKKGQDVFLLGKAWRCFVEDNSIEYGDILQFRLCGNSKFYVMIYDQSCCEKEKITEDVAWRKYQKSKLAKGKVAQGAMHGDFATPKNQNDSLIEKEKELEKQVTLEKCLKRRQGRRAMEKSLDFKSDYPFFVYTLTGNSVGSTRRGFLDLPIKFVRAYLPEMSTDVKVVDPEGRIWDVTYNTKNSRAHLGRGWNGVVLGNELKEDMICAFELIDSKDIKLKISVLENLK